MDIRRQPIGSHQAIDEWREDRDPAYDACPEGYDPDVITDEDCSRDVGELLECDSPPILTWLERALGPRDV